MPCQNYQWHAMASVPFLTAVAAGTVDAAVAATFALDVVDSSAEVGVGFDDAAVRVAFAAFVASVAFVVGKSFELAVAAFAVGNYPRYSSSYLKLLLGHQPSVPTPEDTY